MGEDLSESVFKIHISIRYICIYLYIFYDLFLWHLAPFPRRKSNCRPNWPEFRFGLGLFFQRRLLPRPRYISSSPPPLNQLCPPPSYLLPLENPLKKPTPKTEAHYQKYPRNVITYVLRFSAIREHRATPTSLEIPVGEVGLMAPREKGQRFICGTSICGLSFNRYRGEGAVRLFRNIFDLLRF